MRLLLKTLLVVFLGWGLVWASEDTKTLHASIKDIQVDIQNVHSVGPEMVKAHIKLKQGEKYDPVLADQSIRSMYKTGLFDYIKVSVDSSQKEGLVVIFQVFPKYRISEVTIEGNKSIASKKLLGESKVAVGDPLDEAKIKMDADKIFDFYEKRGYFQTVVSYRLEKEDSTGLGKVIFEVEEGAKLQISGIVFHGNERISKNKLTSIIKTSHWHIFSFLSGGGYLKEKVLREDIERIKDYYHDQGFLDVEINDNDILIEHPKPGKARLVINITEGKQYYTGEIEIAGNTLYSKDILQKIVRLKTGDILSSSVLDQDMERLRDHYGKAGYLDTYVIAEKKANIHTNKIDVKYIVRESSKFYVENIILQGNTNTKSVVILRELALAPGDVFDLVRMKNSEARLKNTYFFSDVNVSHEETNIPNRRNLKIALKEGKTANISFGGGFSSLEKFGLFVEFSQSNFDAFNYRSAFRGGGQKFKIRASLAQKSNEIMISFEEPWVCQRELAIGFDVYRMESHYVSDFYNEMRVGFDVYMRKWFWDMIEGRISYGVDHVNLNNMKSNAPSYLKDEGGKRTVCKWNVTFTYDTRDNLLVPHEGTRLQLITEVAGGPAGGPTKFVRVEGRGGRWWSTFETLDQVLGVFRARGQYWWVWRPRSAYF
jgi:outer membrane protein insertion porin family